MDSKPCYTHPMHERVCVYMLHSAVALTAAQCVLAEEKHPGKAASSLECSLVPRLPALDFETSDRFLTSRELTRVLASVSVP